MSGICGIVGGDDRSASRAAVSAMLAAMRRHAPDGSTIRELDAATLGHAALRTGASIGTEQPFTFDGNAWITADARIDGQPELKAALEARGRRIEPGCDDAGLVLHAYHAWNEDCVHHLIGDFAFAIWDAKGQRLFCARDHFGVKPFFHARLGNSFLFSSSLRTLRALPSVSARLDELAIADFLLFDMNQDPAGTAFADIRRLPPAHTLVATSREVRVRRYWELDPAERITYRRRGEYVERFRELLDTAVADRLRAPRVAISMSGGIDSTSLAALTRRTLGGEEAVKAFTVVHDHVMPDEERHYSQMAADALRIPIEHRAADDYRLFQSFEGGACPYPEPSHEPDGAVTIDHFAAMAGHARVALMGWDGDALLSESPKPYFHALWRQRRFGRLLLAGAAYAASQRRFPARGWWRMSTTHIGSPDPYPRWLNAEFEARHTLRERWHDVASATTPAHPIRPYAHRIYGLLGRLSSFFERFDPGVTGLPLEVRHPYLDLRLLDYCLSLPPQPWCVKKAILRRAMQGALPVAVLRRPKTPLAALPGIIMLARDDARWVDTFVPSAALEGFVDATRVPAARAVVDPDEAWMNLRPITLDLWLRAERATSTFERGHRDETAQGKAPHAAAEEAV